MNATKNLPIAFRPATGTDMAFVFKSWLMCQRRQGERAYMTRKNYFEYEKKRVQRLVARSEVLIACNPEETAQIYGFACLSYVDPLLIMHFLYVKSTYRRMGIARAILTYLGVDIGKEEIAVTHYSPEVATVSSRYRVVFNPLLSEMVQQREGILQ